MIEGSYAVMMLDVDRAIAEVEKVFDKVALLQAAVEAVGVDVATGLTLGVLRESIREQRDDLRRERQLRHDAIKEALPQGPYIIHPLPR